MLAQDAARGDDTGKARPQESVQGVPLIARGVGRALQGDSMDPELKLAVFAAVLVMGTGVIWWRLVTLILRGGVPTPFAARRDPASALPNALSRPTPRGAHPSKS